MKIRVIVTGSTGMVGEGVLLECLDHADFFDLTPLEPQLAGYDACFFCLGASSVGMSAEDYRHITYDRACSGTRTCAGPAS